MTSDDFKRSAAKHALQLVESEMTLGLGTGSTAVHFIHLLGERVRNGFVVRGLPTSEETRKQALAEGIDLIDPDETTRIDLAIDGADEIDSALTLIKGGGGALLREKIIAHSASRFVIIADETKVVSRLGSFALPVEIDKAFWPLTVTAIRKVLTANGYSTPKLTLRGAKSAGFEPSVFFQTDGGNFIVDCGLHQIAEPARLHSDLIAIPGVVETGLFVHMADLAIVAGPDGVREIKPT
ncbi:MAG: ribose-5-phosphate isomerase RpiA [Pseudomonadota bacterium]